VETYRRRRKGKIEIVRKKARLDPNIQGLLGVGLGFAGISAVGAYILARKRANMYADGTASILDNLSKQMKTDAAKASQKSAESSAKGVYTPSKDVRPDREARDRMIDDIVEGITGRRPGGKAKQSGGGFDNMKTVFQVD
jgi:hypothetical protein